MRRSGGMRLKRTSNIEHSTFNVEVKRQNPIQWTKTPPNAFGALVRNDRGGLEARRFATAADAAAVSCARELPTPDDIHAVTGTRRGEMTSTAFAKALGIHPRTVRRLYARGGLPGAKEHGERILLVPTHLLRLATAYGLRQVERMARAGLLNADR